MGNDSLRKKTILATKWSASTQILSKLVVPITNMILARLLVPEAFGVVATVNMIISLGDLLTDAGFQKYIIQHKFEDENEQRKSLNVAFWTNLIVSLIIWAFIAIFSDQIARQVGNPGLGNVVLVSSIVIVFSAFSSIQIGLLRRNLDFRTLFFVRMIAVLTPFLITIPLAFFGFSYWSLIIGNILTALINAIILTVRSPWKPQLFYDFRLLAEMSSFTLWSLSESIVTWLITWSGTFIVGRSLSLIYLGLYKTSMSTVNSITSLVSETVNPVLFSTLSKLQDQKKKLLKHFMLVQKFTSYIVIPLGVGIFLFRDLVTHILLGSQWSEASFFIGIWGLTSTLSIVLGQFNNELYRAVGKPKLSVLAQGLHLVFLVPALLIASGYGYNVVVIVRTLSRIQFILCHFLVLWVFVRISPIEFIWNIKESIGASLVMFLLGLTVHSYFNSIFLNFVLIFLLMVVYIFVLAIFKNSRRDVLMLFKTLKIRIKV